MSLRARVRDWLPPAVGRAAAEALHHAIDAADRARLWQWTALAVRSPEGAAAFAGRAYAWPTARDLLHLGGAPAAPFSEAVRDPACAVACDAPLPGALHVPGGVRLRRRFEPGQDPLLGWSESTRGHARKLSKRPYRWRRATDPAEVARIQEEMLAPFAVARHAERAYVVPLGEVQHLAARGRLDVLLLDGEPVGAHLGAGEVRDGERVWVSIRVGYPRRIFEDRVALADANAVNWLFAVRAAVEEGCAVHDMGLSPGIPDGGLLQFKRHRGGEIDPQGSISTFWLRLPRVRVPELLWRAPVFALEDGGMSLHVGVPEALADEELLRRFRMLDFGGLGAVRLHAARPIAPAVIDGVAASFRKRRAVPRVELVA